MIEPKLSARLAQLNGMSRGQLSIEWRRAFRSTPPELTKDLMVRFIAWQLQVKVSGNLPRSAAKLLDTIADGGSAGADDAATKLKPGTRIVREWNGRLLCVQVIDAGFSFEDRSYRSLSEIAREVTGARWSGPRFFGLKRAKRVGASVNA
jgi:hypothetical protein